MKTMDQQVNLARIVVAFALFTLFTISGCGVLLGGYGDDPAPGAAGHSGSQESTSVGSVSSGAAGNMNTGGNGDSCNATAVKVELNDTSVPIKDSTQAEKNMFAPVATGNCVQMTSGPERVYAVTVGAEGILTAMITASGTMFDSVLYARKGSCDDKTSELCADRTSGAHDLNGGEVLSFPVDIGEVWYIVVDGYDDAANGKGNYELSLSLRTGRDQGSVVPVRFEAGTAMTLLGAVGAKGQNDVWTPTCGGLGEIIYQVDYGTDVKTLKWDAVPLIDTFDPALYATTTVPNNLVSPEVGCESPGCGVTATMSTTPTAPFVVVDGALPGFPNCMDATPGSYRLIVTPNASP